MIENPHQTAAEWLENIMKSPIGEKANGFTLMTMAMNENRTDVMDLLLAKGLDINMKTADHGDTWMHQAVFSGSIKAMEWLKEHNLRINELNSDGNMPIHLAASCDNIEVVEWLLKNGVNVNAKGRCDRTPMHQAAATGKVEIIRYLKKCGADIYARDDGDLSPMDSAISSDQTESIKCLKELGFNVNIKNNGGKTPIFLAIYGNKINSVKCLLDLGVDVNAKDNFGQTPIFIAAMSGNIEIIKSLKKLGADVNEKDSNGMTPIIPAAAMGQIESIKCLVDLGADVNAKTENNPTAIFFAASQGEVLSMKCLKDLGARLDLKANDNMTLLDFAIKFNQPKAIEWLRSEEKLRSKNKFKIIGAVIGIILLFSVISFIAGNNNKTANDNTQKETTYSEMFYIPVISSNGFYKYITLNGKNITEAKYIRAYIFQEGRALVQHRDSLWGYIDTKGNSIASGYKQALSFKDGIAWVNDKGIIKALDLDGNIIKTMPSDLISVWSFYEDFALFSINGMQSYMNKNYNSIGDKHYFADGNRFQEGVASVMCNNGKYGYIDTKGNFTTKCIFDEAKTFKNSMAIVKAGDRWGVINKQGNYILGPYSDVEMISTDESLFKFKKKNENWGWLNSKGEIVIKPIYEEIMSFGNRDIAPVMQEGKWGYINRKGIYVINRQYNVAYPFFNDRALVKLDDNFIIIDRNGRQYLQTGSQRIDPSYWSFINSGIAGGPRIMAVEPSFKCSVANLSNAEKIICRSVKLANLDKETDELYKKALINDKNLANSQKEFLAERNKCNDANCLETMYKSRNNQLHNRY